MCNISIMFYNMDRIVTIDYSNVTSPYLYYGHHKLYSLRG